MTGDGALVAIVPVDGIGELGEGDDLGSLVTHAVELQDGDVLVVSSKVVSKAEGRVVTGDRNALLAQESRRIVATRGATSIVRTHHGLVMAAAGIDASNTKPGTAVLLPVDPDGSARRLREGVLAATGANIAVVVSDTSGRAWRNGQTDIAVGAAGLPVLEDYAGRLDQYGNLLSVTAPAVADEIAGAADLVTGKLSRRPAAVVRGLPGLVLPPGDHGPGAAALVRPESEDMFGYGSREAVLNALLPEGDDGAAFGQPASPAEVASAFRRLCPAATVSAGTAAVEVRLVEGSDRQAQRRLGREEAQLAAAARALGWRLEGDPSSSAADTFCRFRPLTP